MVGTTIDHLHRQLAFARVGGQQTAEPEQLVIRVRYHQHHVRLVQHLPCGRIGGLVTLAVDGQLRQIHASLGEIGQPNAVRVRRQVNPVGEKIADFSQFRPIAVLPNIHAARGGSLVKLQLQTAERLFRALNFHMPALAHGVIGVVIPVAHGFGLCLFSAGGDRDLAGDVGGLLRKCRGTAQQHQDHQ